MPKITWVLDGGREISANVAVGHNLMEAAVANNVQSDTYRSFEVYVVVAIVYLVLSALYRFAFWAIGLGLFERKRRLGTPL